MSSRLVALCALVACLAAGVDASAATKAKAHRPPLDELRSSTTALWTNYKQCQSIRKMRKEGAQLDFSAHWMLRRGAADRNKLFQLVWLATVAKWSTPLIAYFFPSVLPSTFETVPAFVSRLEAAQQAQQAALLSVLQAVDAGKLRAGDALDALSAGSKSKALSHLTHDGVGLEKVPTPVIHAASRALSGPPKILPRALHMQAVRAGMRAIAEGDEALRRTKMNELPRHLLLEACGERAIRVREQTPQALTKGLEEWLALTASLRPDAENQPPRSICDATRLALLAVNTASMTRRASPDETPARHLLYTNSGF